MSVLVILGCFMILAALYHARPVTGSGTGTWIWLENGTGAQLSRRLVTEPSVPTGDTYLRSPRAAFMLGHPFAINLADAEDLDMLPGIGPVLAANILAFRDRHGPFTGPDSFRNVPGIGPALAARLTPMFTYSVP